MTVLPLDNAPRPYLRTTLLLRSIRTEALLALVMLQTPGAGRFVPCNFRTTVTRRRAVLSGEWLCCTVMLANWIYRYSRPMQFVACVRSLRVEMMKVCF